MNGLFSMQGRMGRGQYFLISVLGLVAYFGVMFTLGVLISMTRPELIMAEDSPLLTAISYLAMIPYIIVVSVAQVKRLHDLDRPGSHFWLQLIPLYGYYIQLIILLKPGTAGDNRYGPGQEQLVNEEALAV